MKSVKHNLFELENIN